MTDKLPPVAALLPHAGQAILIDALLEVGDDGARSVARISSAHPFFVAGKGVPAWGGIEMMAQTVAARAGFEGRLAGRAPRAGMLLGTRRYRVHQPWFAEGANLLIEADHAYGGAGGICVCECRILEGGKRLVEAAITILEINPDSER
jgi:predicted hotdog family 3-hydroxylacyl-ACP dehydratase